MADTVTGIKGSHDKAGKEGTDLRKSARASYWKYSIVALGILGLIGIIWLGYTIFAGARINGNGSAPIPALPVVGEWSGVVDLDGCSVNFKEGNGDWYKIQHRLYGGIWIDHREDTRPDANEFRFMLLRDVERLPYTSTCP